MDNESRLFFCGDDLLERGIYAKNLKSIIEKCQDFPKNNDNDSYVIGINAPWGSGKTFFTQMLLSYLEGNWEKPDLDGEEKSKAVQGTGTDAPSDADKRYEVVYYDAWKNDFWDNAFEPLFDNLIKSSPIKQKAANEDVLKMYKSIGKIIALGIKGFLSKKIEDNFDSGVLDEINEEAAKVWNNASDSDYQIEETFPEYVLFKKAIECLKTYLSDAVKATEKLVIIIDELDRCKPTFAVQTLEIVKHLFNVKGLVFILALDMDQLSHSVKVVYGNGFDATGYLERFFNYLTILPHARFSTIDRSKVFINKMGLLTDYEQFDETLIQRFFNITDMFGLSLREVKTVLSVYSVLLGTVLAQYSNYPDAMILYFYFLCMKYKHTLDFSDGVFNNDTKGVIETLTNHRIPFVHYYGNAFYEKMYQILSLNEEISSGSYYILKPDNTRYEFKNYSTSGDTFTQFDNNTITSSKGTVISFKEDMSLSGLLYYPDIKRFDEIKSYRILEFIFRQLEMCDFIRSK